MRLLIPILMLTIGLASGYFLSSNIELLDKKQDVIKRSQKTTKVETLQYQVNTDLSGLNYVGPLQAQIVYRSKDLKTAEYVLKQHNGLTYTLRTEPYNPCGVSKILQSPQLQLESSSKMQILFLSSYACGDRMMNLIMGVIYDVEKFSAFNIESKQYEPIESYYIDLGGSYYNPRMPLAWLDGKTLLVEDTLIPTNEPDATKWTRTLWKVPIDAPTQRTEFVIKK